MTRGTPEKILIAADEPDTHELLCRWLSGEGYECELAADVPRASAALKSGRHALLVSDLGRPGTSELEFFLRAGDKLGDVAVIVIVALEDRQTAIRFLELGAYGYLIKPFEQSELLINVVNALQHRRANKELRALSDSLERRVAERTKELEDSRTTALSMIQAAEATTKKAELTEEGLRESEAKCRTFFEQCKDAVFVSTVDGELLEFNQAMLDQFGYGEDEMREVNAHELYVCPADRPRFHQTIEKKGSFKNCPVRLRRKDGTEIDCLLTATGRMGPSGQLRGYQGIIHDLGERKLLEEQLRQSQKLEVVGQLAGGVAHDFNNMLTGITGYTELVLGTFPTEAPVADDLRKVLEFSHRAAGLTQQLLAFSRRQPLEPEVLNLNALVANTVELLQRLIGENIATEVLTAPDLGNVKVDPGQIEQVLLNLAVNARDAMPEGGKLTIETANAILDKNHCARHPGTTPGRYVTLVCSDTGCGMDETTQRQIFDPFFTTKKRGEGTGLGLATVYGIIKQHGGNIWVHSEEGTGSRFEIYLPRADEEVNELETIERASDSQGSETILLVEDEEATREPESVASFVKQRAYPRVEVVIPVELDVEPGGVTTTGSVINLSRAGLLTSVQHQIKVGQHCAVRFPMSEGRLSGVRAATVVRSQSDESRYLVALQFGSPLSAASGSESLFPAKFPAPISRPVV